LTLNLDLEPNPDVGHVARWFRNQPDNTVLRPLWFPVR